MEINQLRQFKVIAETENITKAAQILYISQPALSQMLANLEDEYGVKFFDRIKKKIQLNENGRKFLTQVNIILKEVAALNMLFEHKENRKYIAGFSAGTAMWYYMPVLYNLTPQYTFDSAQVKQEHMENALINGEIDFAFQFDRIKNMDIYNIPIDEIALYLMVDVSHPLSAYKEVEMNDLTGYDFLTTKTKGNYIGDFIYKTIDDSKVNFNNMVILDDVQVHNELFRNTSNYITISNSIQLAKMGSSGYAGKKAIKIKGIDRLTLYFSYLKTKKDNLNSIIDSLIENYSTIASGKVLTDGLKRNNGIIK